MGLCFAMFVFLTFRGPLASHDSNPYPNRSRIARYNATKIGPSNPTPDIRKNLLGRIGSVIAEILEIQPFEDGNCKFLAPKSLGEARLMGGILERKGNASNINRNGVGNLIPN